MSDHNPSPHFITVDNASGEALCSTSHVDPLDPSWLENAPGIQHPMMLAKWDAVRLAMPLYPVPLYPVPRTPVPSNLSRAKSYPRPARARTTVTKSAAVSAPLPPVAGVSQVVDATDLAHERRHLRPRR